MTELGGSPSGLSRAELLRLDFDRAFADAPAPAAAVEDLLEVRVSTASYALRLAEIAGLFADVPISPLPSPAAFLLGIAGVRGAILPVYDLRAMLGYTVDTKPRWLAIAAHVAVGLGFDGFDRHLRIPRDAIVPHGGGDAALRHVRDVVRLDNQKWPIVSIGSVLDAITKQVRAAAPEKE